LRIAFLTSTPQNVRAGSGTYVGIATLARALRDQAHEVEVLAPAFFAPTYTLQRIWYNEWLRWRNLTRYDLIVGFDMDGYALRVPHVAAIKGVLAEEASFERGLTRGLMLMQSQCERRNVHRASAVITTSRHSAARIAELYAPPQAVRVVPELIDLRMWRELFDAAPQRRRSRFTVLSVARLYRRKRIDVLLKAAAMLDREIELRIVGDGPERARLRAIAPPCATFLGNLPVDKLAAEYKSCNVFCLPSVQEGFGIVLLEAMAAGKPIVAARAAAAPETAPHAVFAEPDDPASFAAAIRTLLDNDAEAARTAAEGRHLVKQYDAPLVARQFLEAASS